MEKTNRQYKSWHLQMQTRNNECMFCTRRTEPKQPTIMRQKIPEQKQNHNQQYFYFTLAWEAFS
jgi:hypothetical protein